MCEVRKFSVKMIIKFGTSWKWMVRTWGVKETKVQYFVGCFQLEPNNVIILTCVAREKEISIFFEIENCKATTKIFWRINT